MTNMNAKEFLMGLPTTVNPSVIEDHNTSFHFIIGGDEPTEITMKIVDGKITSEEGLIGDAKCVVKSTSTNLMKLINKDLNPMLALMTGKLKITNQGEMLKYAKILGLM